MLPKRLLQLRSKNLNESTRIVCNVLWLPASQAPKTMEMEFPNIMGFQSPHPLTAGLEGTKCTRGSRGHEQMGTTCLHRCPHQRAWWMNAAVTGRPPSQNIPSASRGECTSLGIWKGASERESWGKLAGGWQPKQTTHSTSHAPSCLSWKHSQPHNLSPGQTQWLKGWSVLDSSEQQSI